MAPEPADLPADALWNIALGGLSAAHIARVHEALREHRYDAHTVLYREGCMCKHVNVLVQGRARSFHYTRSGRESTNLVSGPGAVLGLIGCTTDEPAVITIEALEPLLVWQIRAPEFTQLMADIPSFARNIARMLGRLYGQSVQRSQRSVDPAAVRLGKVLFGLLTPVAQNSGEVRGLTQQNLSTMVDATRSWVTQMLNRLDRSNLISLQRGLIYVPDVAALERHFDSIHHP